MTISQVQQEIVSEFEMFDEWMAKYSYIIEIGNELNDFNEKDRVDQNLIEGCQSRVWLNGELIDGKVVFTADSDAIITKGIVALLIRVYSNRTPDEILDSELFFVDKIGLKEHLSPTRSNGLLSMIKQIRLFALAYKSKLSN